MVLNILSSLILVDQKRRLVEVFPDSVRKEWNRWELRGLVLVSLSLQIALICSGNRRKYIAKRRIRIFIWCAYLMADWIATVALGLLVDRQGNSSSSGHIKNESGDLRLMAFWAPFLLLHLGGPDTITAYALADNELWLRHLLGLLVQTAAAIYITLLAWNDTLISFLTIPMLLCGIIKYGERSWVLMSANRDQFRDSVLTDRDPGPSYAKFMEEFCLKEAEGYYVTAAQVEEGQSPGEDPEQAVGAIPSFPNADSRILHIADYFFETLKFKRLFVDLILGFHPRDESQFFFEKQEYDTAFEVIEVELGFAYDVFYTKAPIIYTPFGLFFRLMTSVITLFVLLTFIGSISVRSHTHPFVDVVITCIMLVGAILLEAYAATSLLYSDWANLWFSKQSSKIPVFSRLVSSPQSVKKTKRWSNSMYQYSLLDFCLNQKSSALQKISRFIPMHRRIENLWEKWVSIRQLKHLNVSTELKSFIFKHFREKSVDTELDIKILFTCRGGVSLHTHKSYGTFKWTVDVEFDHSILIWHIATDLCYNQEKSKRSKNSDSNETKQEWDHYMTYSKQLADYMLYILVMCPFMLPIGIGMIRFRDTCGEALVFFEERSSTSKVEAYEMLGQVSTKVFPATVKGDRSKSVLFEACKLAASLNDMGDPGKMWKMVGDVWVEILGYAASQCRGFDHAQQLEKGGELLTHVWLLMAHLGITEHFKIKEGHGRVKLAVT
ncbi:Disease resistance protein [Artemisia annua]|uniref:Disease resistance protein n=1 Tax=Artemisia annua TaxID=35608 RepID=A0A2U1M7E4_ARTAN|nr:Disease resistance protein [Artemisia annua]